jgi:hypothetical protein
MTNPRDVLTWKTLSDFVLGIFVRVYTWPESQNRYFIPACKICNEDYVKDENSGRANCPGHKESRSTGTVVYRCRICLARGKKISFREVPKWHIEAKHAKDIGLCSGDLIPNSAVRMPKADPKIKYYGHAKVNLKEL